ncbi:hypothetical protein DM02DRAFT_29048 [Periconia macrospinosa]|uniref:Uncharacterized protein n=1 Tax=Periconia macrospinosa TaxID=97972 RepID=A0A2V1CXC8_9PLEO|nr:hypothetical protein DM02DRAFT_29048 [Periconia macrospinosa]
MLVFLVQRAWRKCRRGWHVLILPAIVPMQMPLQHLPYLCPQMYIANRTCRSKRCVLHLLLLRSSFLVEFIPISVNQPPLFLQRKCIGPAPFRGLYIPYRSQS